MIASFEDFCTWAYVVIDDLWPVIAPRVKRPGPAPACRDSELLTLVLVGECRGWDQEAALHSGWQDYRHLFPCLPERSRLNRRRRQLAEPLNVLRRVLLSVLDVAQCQLGILDSLPVPVVQFHLAKTANPDWRAHGAAYGRVPTKAQTIFGYKLHLLLTVGGVILDFELVPANVPEHEAGSELLDHHTDRVVVADKGYLDAADQADLWQRRRVRLITLPRRNQLPQPSPAWRHLVNHTRQLIETVNGQLVEQFHLAINHAHSFDGLRARLYAKLTAHTLCLYLNRLLGVPDWLQIKRLAFPI